MNFVRIKNDPDDTARALVEGREIAQVYRAWFRNGGDSWTHTLCGAQGWPTRREAGADALRVYKRIAS